MPPTNPAVASDTDTTNVVLDHKSVKVLYDTVIEVASRFTYRHDTGEPSYTRDFLAFYVKALGILGTPNSTWEDTLDLDLIPDGITSWHDYVVAILASMPIMQAVLTVQTKGTRTKNSKVTILKKTVTDSVYQLQVDSHDQWVSKSEAESLSTTDTNVSLKEDVKRIEMKLDKELNELKQLIERNQSIPTDDILTEQQTRESALRGSVVNLGKNIPDLTSKLDIPAILEAPTPVICRFAKSLTLNETDPSTETKNEKAYHDPKGPTDDNPQEPTLPSEEAYPCGDDDERKALLAEGLLDDEIDQLFEEDEMNAHLDETTQTHSSDFNADPDQTYDGAYYDSAYHDGFKNGIAELAYDNGYSAGYDDGSHEPNYHNDSASDYYSDSSYDDGYYSEAPD